jgi:lipopolysaccharide biosynthesis regulator YciM
VLDPIWLLLLLPLAAVSGWIAGRRDRAGGSGQSTGDIPSDYFKGMNFLINEQPDKAIDVFIKVLEVDTETVETHLMLGNLFRRRGEVERATRVHQNLIARPNLDRDQRSNALYELAQDYLKAGLLDRAENLLLEYAEVERKSEPALRHLLYIYQQEKEWDQAIETARRLARVSGTSTDEMIAHFYCEKADESIKQGEPVNAENLLKQAQAADKGSVRATIMQGDIARQGGDCQKALKLWLMVEKQDPQYLPEVLDRLKQCYDELDDTESWEAFLRKLLQGDASIPVMLTLADEIETRQGVDEARKFITEELRRRPSMSGLAYLVRLTGIQAHGQAREDMQILQGMIDKAVHSRHGYVCQHCGFRAKALHWQCPGCKRWNTVKPVWDEVCD